MAHGVLFETDPFITKCINRGGIATVDLDGGAVVVEGAISSTDKELYEVAVPTATTVKKVAIVYNPSKKYDVVGGNIYPALSADDRNYYNIAGKVLDYWIPEVGVEFGVTMGNIEGTTEPTVGKFLEVTANKATFSIKASQTANVPSFEVVDIIEANYPTGDFTEDVEKVFVVKTRFN